MRSEAEIRERIEFCTEQLEKLHVMSAEANEYAAQRWILRWVLEEHDDANT